MNISKMKLTETDFAYFIGCYIGLGFAIFFDLKPVALLIIPIVWVCLFMIVYSVTNLYENFKRLQND